MPVSALELSQWASNNYELRKVGLALLCWSYSAIYRSISIDIEEICGKRFVLYARNQNSDLKQANN